MLWMIQQITFYQHSKKQAHPACKGKDVNDFATTKGFKLAMAIVLLNCDELAELNNELFSNLIMSVLL